MSKQSTYLLAGAWLAVAVAALVAGLFIQHRIHQTDKKIEDMVDLMLQEKLR